MGEIEIHPCIARAKLCCAVLCCAVLCCAVLCCAVQWLFLTSVTLSILHTLLHTLHDHVMITRSISIVSLSVRPFCDAHCVLVDQFVSCPHAIQLANQGEI